MIPTRRAHVSEAVSAVSLKDLISSRLINPPIDLTRKYKGQELFAQIESDGRVSCLGDTYDSVSLAAGMPWALAAHFKKTTSREGTTGPGAASPSLPTSGADRHAIRRPLLELYIRARPNSATQ